MRKKASTTSCSFDSVDSTRFARAGLSKNEILRCVQDSNPSPPGPLSRKGRGGDWETRAVWGEGDWERRGEPQALAAFRDASIQNSWGSLKVNHCGSGVAVARSNNAASPPRWICDGPRLRGVIIAAARGL
jgi:hypothetical protein